MSRFEWLKSVWAIVAAMVLGAVIGLYAPGWAFVLSNIGNMYISFLIMCVPPIMLTAISSSLARLVNNESAGRHIRRMLVVFASFMLTVGTVAVLTMLVFKPGGTLSQEAQVAIGQMIRSTQSGAAAGAAGTAGTGGGWADLFLGIIPQNMFAAVVESNYPQILFVSILLGLLLGFVRLPSTGQLVELAELGFKMFQQAISWSTYVLPVAILGIVAGQVARTGFEIVFALIKLLAVGLSISVVMALAAMMLMSRVLSVSWGELWSVLRRPIVMGFGTSNSMAVMPLLMDSLEDGFRLPRQLVNLVVPLSVLIARNANVLYGGMMLMFAAQLYNVDLTAGNVIVLILATVIGTLVGAGMPTIPFLTALTVVAHPMGFPIEAIIPIFVAILPVLDPFGTSAAVTLHAAASSVIIGKSKDAPQPMPAGGVGARASSRPVGAMD